MSRQRNRRRRDFSERRPTGKRNGPRLTVGEVVFLLQPEARAAVGLGKRSGAMGAVILAQAATMRIGTVAENVLEAPAAKAGARRARPKDSV